MPNTTNAKNFDETVDRLVATGRFSSREQVIREGVRLLEARERKLATLDAALARGLADAEAGRMTPAEGVFSRLERKYASMSQNAVSTK